MTLREELCLYIKSKNMTQREFSSSIGISEGVRKRDFNRKSAA